MPIFHDIDSPPLSRPPPTLGSGGYDPIMRRPSEERLKTEFFDGPVPAAGERGTLPVENVMATISQAKLETRNRAELIKRIKRGESPTWIPSGTVS